MAMPTYSNSRLYWWTALSVHQHHLCRLHASQTYSKIIKHQDLIISSPVTSSINFWDCKANLHTYSYNKHLQWWQKRVLRDLYVPHVHFCLLECMWNWWRAEKPWILCCSCTVNECEWQCMYENCHKLSGWDLALKYSFTQCPFGCRLCQACVQLAHWGREPERWQNMQSMETDRTAVILCQATLKANLPLPFP